METVIRSAIDSGLQGEREGMNRQNTKDFSGSENTLYDIMRDTCYYTFAQTH